VARGMRYERRGQKTEDGGQGKGLMIKDEGFGV